MRIQAPDFTQDERRDINAILQRRYGAKVAVELGDSELILDPLPVLLHRRRGVASAGLTCLGPIFCEVHTAPIADSELSNRR